MTTLLLVRHGLPEVVLDADYADPPLTQRGRQQAGAVAGAAAGGAWGTVSAVVSSTMRRARETTQPLTDALALEAGTDDRLVEFDAGWTSHGAGLEAYSTRQAAFEAMNDGRWGANTFDPKTFTSRVVRGMEAVIESHPTGTVAVVCHGGVISAYLAHVLGIERTIVFAPDHGSVSRVLAETSGYREVLSVNEAQHLRGI